MLPELPNEIIRSIFDNIADVSTLSALVRTCRVFHQLYLSSRQKILSAITVRQLTDNGDDIIDPLAAVLSSTRLRAESKDHCVKVAVFLDHYQRPKESDYFQSLHITIEESIALVRLQKMVDYLLNDFLDYVGFFLESVPLGSRSERRRIRRAFYRWQLHSNIFLACEDEGYQTDNQLEDLVYKGPIEGFIDAQIFDQWNPWEVEELVTIYHYAFSLYWHFLKKDDETVRKSPSQAPDCGDQSPNTQSTLDDSDEEDLEDDRTTKIAENLILYGPNLLHRCLTTPKANGQRDLILGHIGYNFPTLGDTFEGLSEQYFSKRHSPIISDKARMARYQVPFKGDEVATGPNAGWVIFSKNELEVPLSDLRLIELARHGYALWDWDRLKPGRTCDLSDFGGDMCNPVKRASRLFMGIYGPNKESFPESGLVI